MKKPLHQLIAENSKRIVEKFVAEAREHSLPPRSLSHEEVVDHLHRYLAEIVHVLSAGLADQIKSSIAAKKHGEQRWYAGYDLKSVILEYGLFRKVIIEIVKATDETLTLEHYDPLTQLIHVAIADAAVEFMENSVLHLNEALRLAEQAKEARDEVLAIVSHDLRNPLNVVQGSTAILSRELESLDVDARANFNKSVGRIQRASATMHRLIDDLLDLGRVRAGEFELRQAPHQTEALLREAFEQAAPLAEQRGIQLRKVAAPSVELTCDRDRVLQVLANLLGNAIKFSSRGDIVTLGATCTDEACTFEVSDTGPGIPPERLPYLFDRYWQAPDVTEKGSGLGLAIAKAFMELHGGSIRCESEPNHGARFLCVLPRAASKPGSAVS